MISKNFVNSLIGRFGIEVHGSGYLQSLAKGEFKNDAFGVQQRLIKRKNPVIFDVGANNGSTTAKYLEHFPSASIYAFEPFPGSFQQLKNAHVHNNRVHCIPKAVGENPGNQSMYVNNNVDTNSLLKPVITGLSSDRQVKVVSTISVETITLDNFCLGENIREIDILKMDIQGGEYAALKGSCNMFAQSAISLVYTEVYFVRQYEEQPLFHEISALLFNYGLRLQDIYNPIYGNGRIAWADAIFIKA